MEQTTVKQFLLKKFPTHKYMDCPVPKHHWDTMQEYAEAYHESLKSDLPNEPFIDIRSISEKWVGIWQRGENPNLFQCVDEAIKEALKPSIQEEGLEQAAKFYSVSRAQKGTIPEITENTFLMEHAFKAGYEYSKQLNK